MGARVATKNFQTKQLQPPRVLQILQTMMEIMRQHQQQFKDQQLE